MLSPKAKSLGMALDAANQARAHGKGWGTGEIAHLAKPLIPKGAEVAKAPMQPLNRTALHHHKWLCGGCGEAKLTTGGSKKINGVKVCAQCVAGKATA